MDPNVTLDAFLNACVEQDRETAAEMLDYLRWWIARDGFLPRDPREPIRAEVTRLRAENVHPSRAKEWKR